ncbi:hypothetical protein XBLMG947_3132 [Xanthomonas bromi]|uniref:Uncharacterized protein n=1 Tax=Xanthomonas bromi TaxID=56449 RepID=A0A1C3NPL9_9XANT|nr:hypothetical protein [Xanthomonas bromi]SBV52337.1 hypothetical protein XBLMG947_3132 [Xanthomonas bromi]
MSKEKKLRELSAEERALVFGGAQVETQDLPGVTVTPDPEPDFPPNDSGFPSDPWDPGDGGGGGGGDGSVQVSGDSWTQTDKAWIDASGIAHASQSWTNPDLFLTLNMSESYNLTTGAWGLAANGNFSLNGNNYSLGMTTDHFTITGASAAYTYDWGGGLTFQFSINYDATTNDYKSEVKFTIPSGP